MKVRDQRHDCLKHTTADQNRQCRRKYAGDRLYDGTDLILGGLFNRRPAFRNVDLCGNFIKNCVDLCPDDNLKLSAL